MGIILRYKDLLNTYKTRTHRIKHLGDYKGFFPIKANQRMAGIVADLICDGNLQGNPKWRIDYTSKSTTELQRFESEMIKLFNKEGKVRKCTTNKLSKTYNLGINCSPISRILFLCGVPSGQKVLTSFSIPFWIKKDREYFRRFAQRVFSCEGSIMYEENRKIPQIRLTMWKSEKLIKDDCFVEELARYLKQYFNINSTVSKSTLKSFNLRKDGIITRPKRIYITGKSVIIFYREVGFEGKKQEKLKKLLGPSGFAS